MAPSGRTRSHVLRPPDGLNPKTSASPGAMRRPWGAGRMGSRPRGGVASAWSAHGLTTPTSSTVLVRKGATHLLHQRGVGWERGTSPTPEKPPTPPINSSTVCGCMWGEVVWWCWCSFSAFSTRPSKTVTQMLRLRYLFYATVSRPLIAGSGIAWERNWLPPPEVLPRPDGRRARGMPKWGQQRDGIVAC